MICCRCRVTAGSFCRIREYKVWGDCVTRREIAIKLIGAAIMAGVAHHAAHAADLAVRPAPAVTPAYSWTGFYVGANIGLGVGENRGRVNIPGIGGTPSFDVAPSGVIGGGQAGYNWQIGDWVLGIEADIQGSGVDSSTNCVLNCLPGSTIAVSQSMPWFGTVRGRLGSPLGNLMIYNTAGFAYGEVRTSIADTIGGSGNYSQTRSGWTIGSGVEANLGGNWIGKVEYLYINLGDVNFPLTGGAQSFTGTAQLHVLRVGANYKFGAPGAPSASSVPKWAGFYAGGNFGGGVAHNSATSVVGAPIGPVAETFDITPNGWFGGGQAGYNWQAANWVYGLEADIHASGQESTQTCALACVPGSFLALKQEIPWFGTVRGRVGYSVGAGLFFVTGGWAYAEVKNTVTEFAGGAPLTALPGVSTTRSGFAVGGGIETPVPDFFFLKFPNWTTRTEYLYLDLGSVTDTYVYGGAAHTLTTDVRNHVFRTTFNYKFNGL